MNIKVVKSSNHHPRGYGQQMEEEIALLTHKMRRSREERHITVDDVKRSFSHRRNMRKQLEKRVKNLRNENVWSYQKGE